jgi:dUTPase
MILNFTKLTKSTVDPEQITAGKTVFRLFSNETRSLEPLERAEIGTGIMLFIPPTLTVKVFPSEKLIHSGLVSSPKIMAEGEEVRIAFLNTAVPDFLYLKSESTRAHSSLFGSANKFRFEVGDELAVISIEKSLENLSLREIM